MALSAVQIMHMQGDLAIGDDESVFTDAELQQFFERAGSDYNLAVYYGWRQILSGAAKWLNYRVAQTQVDRSQAFDHILAMVAFWADESRTNANQMRIVGMRPVPTAHKPRPAEEYARPDQYGHYPWRWR